MAAPPSAPTTSPDRLSPPLSPSGEPALDSEIDGTIEAEGEGREPREGWASWMADAGPWVEEAGLENEGDGEDADSEEVEGRRCRHEV